MAMKPLRLPSMGSVFFTAVVSASAMLATQAAETDEEVPEVQESSEELREIYEEDQGARLGVDFSQLSPEQMATLAEEDRDRKERVLEMLEENALHTSDDYFHAAMVLQHGESPDDYLLAHILSTVSAIKGHKTGIWLSAASLDRFLMQTDQPQVFGTQFRQEGKNCTQAPFNEELVSDALREQFHVPSLEDSRMQLAKFNGQ